MRCRSNDSGRWNLFTKYPDALFTARPVWFDPRPSRGLGSDPSIGSMSVERLVQKEQRSLMPLIYSCFGCVFWRRVSPRQVQLLHQMCHCDRKEEVKAKAGVHRVSEDDNPRAPGPIHRQNQGVWGSMERRTFSALTADDGFGDPGNSV